MAVQGVSSEPVSPEFPVKQGKNREFSQNQAMLGRIGCSNELLSRVFLLEFPKHRNREIFQPNREFKPQNRELSGGSGNRRTGPPQLQIGGPQTTRIIDLAGALVGSNPGQDLFKNVPTWSSEKPFDIGFRGTISTISYSDFGFRSDPRVNAYGGTQPPFHIRMVTVLRC